MRLLQRNRHKKWEIFKDREEGKIEWERKREIRQESKKGSTERKRHEKHKK